MLNSLVASISSIQRMLQQALAGSIRDMGADAGAALAAVGFALALGMVHALTPGHGKLVVFSYFLGRRSRALAGFAVAAKIAFVHSASALVLVLAFGAAASSFGRPAGPALALQTASYAVIAAIGAFYLWQALCRRDGAPDMTLRRSVSGGVMPFAVGLLPCPLTMVIVSFAMVHGSVTRGLILAALVAAGAAMTIGAVGLLGIALRASLLGRLDPDARLYRVLLTGLEIASSMAILALGAMLFVGSLCATPADIGFRASCP